MAKITAYTSAARFDDGDVLIKDGTNGTRIITAQNAASEFAGLVSAVNHRNVFRGKNLGTSITESQLSAINDGTFDDLFIGDYWTLGGVRYDIADMDYWYGYGDPEFTLHHLAMIPHTTLSNDVMNDTDTTAGGYYGSKMYTTVLSPVRTQIAAVFGTKLLTHKEYLVNAVTDGKASAAAWYDSTVDLMNETMFYGSPRTQSSSINTMANKDQLSILRLSPHFYGRKGVWLRDVSSDTQFCSVNLHGSATANGASNSRGILPVFAIGVRN